MAWIEGEKVGAYILGKQIGQGGMATVYLGHHPQLDRQVAIKVMHQNFLDDEGFVARFKREAQIVAKLNHPHIVPVFDYDEHDGQPYLVMKYVQGWTLKKQVIKDPLDLEGVLRVVTAIGDALNYAHEQGVLHRDIKPSNIVIDRDGIAFLTDFGLARLASSGESTMSADMLLGTPHYISPEQARGLKELDGRTDIYSLGVVLYELLVGKVPFTGDSAFSIIHDHIYTPLPPPTKVNPELPQAVENILYKALEKQPSDRYDSANEMIHDLTKAIKQSNLTELDPNRAFVAEESLARIRESYGEQLTVTPSAMGVGSPIPMGSSSVRKATMYAKEKPFYDQARFWLISGCGSLLIIVFLSFAVLLGMSGNIQELAALSLDDGRFSEVREDLFGNIRSLVDAHEYGVQITETGDVPVLSIPYVELAALPEVAEDPIIALLRARSLYEEASETEARQEIITNNPENTGLRVLYYISAAQVADNVGDIGAALVFNIVATEAALENEELFSLIRPLTLQFIYEHVGEMRAINLTETMRSIVNGDSLPSDTISEFENSVITSFATARNLILNENTVLARTTLARIDEPNVITIELDLLRADLQMILGNTDNARSLLDAILENDDTPEWVSDRVEVLQNELD